MSNLSIESTVPAPAIEQYNWRANLDKLEIGQSFSFPKEKRNSVASVISVSFHAIDINLKRFTVSSDPNDKKLLRVWRIADAIKED